MAGAGRVYDHGSPEVSKGVSNGILTERPIQNCQTITNPVMRRQIAVIVSQ
jgi:hypothetical protein